MTFFLVQNDDSENALGQVEKEKIPFVDVLDLKCVV
jgi:hypothetical protein